MIKYLKRFWSECFDGDIPTPYAQLHIYRLAFFTGVICFLVSVLIILFGSLFYGQFDPGVWVLLLIGIGNTIFGTLLLQGLRRRYSNSDLEANKN
ncbi:MAG: hypothetical protein OXG88_03350 [Gammaproteobacteria bacterium]|nr:hypothetical protein [Gammaproteobacteria bacterium]